MAYAFFPPRPPSSCLSSCRDRPLRPLPSHGRLHRHHLLGAPAQHNRGVDVKKQHQKFWIGALKESTANAPRDRNGGYSQSTRRET